MTRTEALRVAALAGVAEMALTRRDPVTPALLAQAARAAEGLPPGPCLAAAADLARTVDLADRGPEGFAARKVAQALCRIALQEAQAALLA